ncbi:hypothetical protein [Ancylobacter sp. IITR112]|uniref:hypothetical protein n=1 Tax=Ancylobacter sp. IITR112 TaxID=3138073 RepID=UPI00352ABAB4
MNRAAPLRLPPRPPDLSPAGDSLPGRDAVRDHARHYAAVGVFGVAALSVLSVAVAAYVLRPGAAGAPQSPPLTLETSGFPTMGVAADMPALRPSLGADDGVSITVFDGATGRREVLAGPGLLDSTAPGPLAGGTGDATLTP